MNEKQERQLGEIIAAVLISAGMIGTLAFIDLVKKDIHITDVGATIVFTRALTDNPAYKQCVKKNLRTIKEFKDCLVDLGAM